MRSYVVLLAYKREKGHHHEAEGLTGKHSGDA